MVARVLSEGKLSREVEVESGGKQLSIALTLLNDENVAVDWELR